MDVEFEFVKTIDDRIQMVLNACVEDNFKEFLVNVNAFRFNNQLCDVELECDGEIFSAHKVLLAATIDYFKGLYNFGMVDAQQKRIQIKDVSSNGLKQILDFAYTYHCTISEENVKDLLQASNYLGVKFVKDGCENFLIQLITTDNCLELRELADLHCCQKLLSAIDVYLLEHFMEFCTSLDFLTMNSSVNTIEHLAKSDHLNIHNEKQLFEFIVRWVEEDKTERIVHFPRLLKHIRFFQLPLDYFLGTVRQHPLVAQSPEAETLIRVQTEAFLNVVAATTSQQRISKRKAPSDELMSGISQQIGSSNLRTSTSSLSQLINSNGGSGGNQQIQSIADSLEPHQMATLLCQKELALQSRPRKVYAGVIFCVGGRGAKLDPFRSVECYDWLHDKWRQIGELRIGRRHVGVICVGPKIYAIGGHDGTEHLSSVECLDVRNESWMEVAPLNVRRRGMAVNCVGSAIYAIGGLDDQNCYKTVERYDIDANRWTHVAEMNVPRGGVAVATFENQLYAIGGNSGTSSLESCECYDPILDKWTHISKMKNRRAGAGVAVIGAYLYVIGGFDDDSPLSTCERYSFAEDTWTDIASLSCARGGVGVCAMGGRIFAIGGHDSRNYLNTVEAYDPITGKWEDIAPINQKRAGAGVAHSTCNINEITFPTGQLKI